MQSIISLLTSQQNWLMLTGAGVSAESGVPTYRDRKGVWQRLPPVTHQAFMADHHARQRFWARNMVGWRHMVDAQPNRAHRALVALEELGLAHYLVTQNVDGLHQRAGSQRVIDLHGRVDTVSCMNCGLKYPRAPLQIWLEQHNPDYSKLSGTIAPDGDADIDYLDFSQLQVPDCQHCGGILKPDAVFYGDSVSKEKVQFAEQQLRQSRGLLVLGSSLAVYSGYRFCLWAQEQDKPIVILNDGETRADHLATAKAEGSCATVLEQWLEHIASA